MKAASKLATPMARGRLSRAVVVVAVCALTLAGTFAYSWDSKAGEGDPNDTLAVMVHGYTKQRVQAVVQSSDAAVEIVEMLRRRSNGAEGTVRDEAIAALRRIRDHIER